MERLTETADSGGSITQAWSTIRKFKGFLRSMRGKELIMYSRETAQVNYKLICDYISDVSVHDRVRIGTITYDIQHTDNTIPKYTKLYLEERT